MSPGPGSRLPAAWSRFPKAEASADSMSPLDPLAPAVESCDAIDVTLPGHRPRLGHRHPLSQTADELIDLFGRFGFAVARGPEVEDVRHNFEALNIPSTHPARDPLDNFYISDHAMLR